MARTIASSTSLYRGTVSSSEEPDIPQWQLDKGECTQTWISLSERDRVLEPKWPRIVSVLAPMPMLMLLMMLMLMLLQLQLQMLLLIMLLMLLLLLAADCWLLAAGCCLSLLFFNARNSRSAPIRVLPRRRQC